MIFKKQIGKMLLGKTVQFYDDHAGYVRFGTVVAAGNKQITVKAGGDKVRLGTTFALRVRAMNGLTERMVTLDQLRTVRWRGSDMALEAFLNKKEAKK